MDMQKENLWIHNTSTAFTKGAYNGTVLTKDHKIKLYKKDEKYVDKGVYVSEAVYTKPFDSLILSWNADTPKDTAVEVEAQVLVNKHTSHIWSGWLSFGRWNSHGTSSSASKASSSDELAFIETDTIKIKTPSDETGSAVKYRLTLFSANLSKTPSVRLIAGTFRNTKETLGHTSLLINNESDLSTLDKELKVPCISQMLRDPQIAGVICSPTSVSMILNYYGLNMTPEEVAANVYDKEYDGYGNWPFNTAFAGCLGFEAYVCFCTSIYDLKKEIYNGNPVIVSVRYKNSEEVDAKLPIIHGSPIAKTNGHLIVVCGFTIENDNEYVIVNDPAASNNYEVRLKYLLKEFEKAWISSGRTAYIIHP